MEPNVEQALAARKSRINRPVLLIQSGFVSTPKLLSTNGMSEPSSPGTPEALAIMWELARYTEAWLHARTPTLNPLYVLARGKRQGQPNYG